MKRLIKPILWASFCTLLTACSHGTKESEMKTMPKLSVQLWSVKDVIKTDFTGTLEQLAAMGFEGVEFAGEFGVYKDDPQGLKQYLSSLNLQASGAHVSFEQLNDDNFTKTVNFYQQLGAETLIIGWDERAWHPEGIKEVVALLNKLEQKLQPYGIKTGFHNHDHEFDDYLEQTYWDYLAKNTGENVVLQQDVGWTTYAGKDPVDYVQRYPQRTYTTHYKVRLPEGSIGKLPIIGKDTINWSALLQANIAVGGTKWIVVEQEEYPNGLSSLAAVALSKKGLDAYIANL
ncbi:sugar phosphate isomerase/epimerase family protein [Thalassotalea sp. PLHSN55]|uniref:sugar phosphate isomerase/epimerase family protein n=1 Tax=Thalassotalea sp. PLHSN55 TaxID=3435888 RepID=UPI003F840108